MDVLNKQSAEGALFRSTALAKELFRDRPRAYCESAAESLHLEADWLFGGWGVGAH